MIDNRRLILYGYATMNDWLIATNTPVPTSPVAWAAGGWRLSHMQQLIVLI
ncbi:MAG: hypothetical protein H6656_12125 [Ardenticatenaceae bacterium]|nr:hypothetical protein [Anaerolineales bacterium]MCB9008092.1 hypothetical protein [Ardenticatenaceae bacterium]